jgi:formate dehydrogenase maturation protein FdhE
MERLICAYCHTEKNRIKCLNCGASKTIENTEVRSKIAQENQLFQGQNIAAGSYLGMLGYAGQHYPRYSGLGAPPDTWL